MKFYIISLTHKRTNIKLYKFGITKSRDVLSRFDVNRYPERRKYSDFNIKVLFGCRLEEEKCLFLEREFAEIYPRIDVNKELGTESGYYDFSNLTGITEWRKWDDNQIDKILSLLYKKKRKDPSWKS